MEPSQEHAEKPSRTSRRALWLAFSIGFALSLLGAIVLFVPALEFTALDLVERLGFHTPLIGNLVLYTELALFVVCGCGLLVLSVLRLASRKAAKPC